MTDIDTFFTNFSLSFVSRDPNDQKISNCPSSMNEARMMLLGNTKKNDSYDISTSILQTLYLCAIGEFMSPCDFPVSPSEKFAEIVNHQYISQNSFGFLNEMNIQDSRSRIHCKDSNAEGFPYYQLMRYCFSHGIQVTHDISLNELQRMVSWIIRNENDQVLYEKFPEFMQQAIDLSVVAQNTDRLSDSISQDSKLHKLVLDHISSAEEQLNSINQSVTDIVRLNSELSVHGRALSGMRFQELSLQSLQNPDMIVIEPDAEPVSSDVEVEEENVEELQDL